MRMGALVMVRFYTTTLTKRPGTTITFLGAAPSACLMNASLASAAASMDPAGLARVYSILKPRLIEAYAELGHPAGDLDAAVERAVVQLLEAPVVDEPIVLRPRVLSWPTRLSVPVAGSMA